MYRYDITLNNIIIVRICCKNMHGLNILLPEFKRKQTDNQPSSVNKEIEVPDLIFLPIYSFRNPKVESSMKIDNEAKN